MYLRAESIDKPRRTGIIEIEKGAADVRLLPHSYLKENNRTIGVGAVIFFCIPERSGRQKLREMLRAETARYK